MRSRDRNDPRGAEVDGVLIMLLTTLSLCALAVFGVAKAGQSALRRFDLDVMTVLLWLGLAERPS